MVATLTMVFIRKNNEDRIKIIPNYKLSKPVKIKTGETNAQNDNDTHLSIIPSSSTSLINNINNNLVSNNIKKINDIIASDKKVMRSSSVGYFNFDNYKQNNKKGRFFESSFKCCFNALFSTFSNEFNNLLLIILKLSLLYIFFTLSLNLFFFCVL